MSNSEQALKHLAQVSNDLAQFLPPSARGPALTAAQQAVNEIDASLQRLAELEKLNAAKDAPPAGGKAEQTV